MASVITRICRKIEYILNKTKRYDFPSTNGEWKKMKTPVYGDRSTGSIFDPYVFYLNGTYRMYVSERKMNGVDVCISKDGIHWKNTGKALDPDSNSGWEDKVNRVSVCCKDGKWYMWYTGQNKVGSQIGFAISQDGYKFNRIRNNPVLSPDLPFEEKSVMNPCVVWDEESQIFKMWYAAGEMFEPDVLCYAESEDGILWNKYKEPILIKSDNKYDCCKVGGCDVKKLSSSNYIMFYIGYQNVDTARICMASSDDGIEWKRAERNPILSPEKGAWDCDAVYKPAVIIRDNWSLWYNGRSGNKEYIGYAKKGDNEL